MAESTFEKNVINTKAKTILYGTEAAEDFLFALKNFSRKNFCDNI